MPASTDSVHTASALFRLLASCIGAPRARRLFATINVHPRLGEEPGETVSPAVLAQALTMILFDDLLERVPTGRAYVDAVLAEGRKVTFDHGALRTVKGLRTGALPGGNEAFARILEPLGYGVAAVYPLDRIAMTGRAYTHRDWPQQIPQFFVSELHPERFSPGFQKAVDRVLETSRDPVTPEGAALLAELNTESALALHEAARLLAVLAGCFARQHEPPTLSDYEILLAESPAMAWIATEGNIFNHATDRVADVSALAKTERRAGHPIKDSVETSSNGRFRQTAYRAAMVERVFLDQRGSPVSREVPGSFYEFISRDLLPDGSGLDLGFDAGNAQGIFKMTAAGH
jgi:hypothetical protein